MAKPSKFAHIVYRTRRFEEMIAWYQKVFEAKVQYQNPGLAFLTYDDEHHRFAFANLAVLDDLRDIRVSTVLYQGEIVAQDGEMVASAPDTTVTMPASLLNTMHMAPLFLSDLRLDPSEAREAVGVIHGEITTRLLDVEPTVRDGWAVADLDRDLLKLVCVERHHATGRVGVSYVQGFGLRRGALASSGRRCARLDRTTPRSRCPGS